MLSLAGAMSHLAQRGDLLKVTELALEMLNFKFLEFALV